MRLLISDANILIDMEAGALMETLFLLPMQFGIPDLLYYEEIEPGSPGLEDLGLQIMEVSGDFVAYAQQLPGQHNHLLPAKNGPKPSHNDYLALALAKQETCTLLTGDANLRIAANKEQVNVMGISFSLNQLRWRFSGSHSLIQVRQRLYFLCREEELQRRRNLEAILTRANFLQDAVLLDLLDGGMNPFHEPCTVGVGGALIEG